MHLVTQHVTLHLTVMTFLGCVYISKVFQSISGIIFVCYFYSPSSPSICSFTLLSYSSSTSTYSSRLLNEKILFVDAHYTLTLDESFSCSRYYLLCGTTK
jgi:hypothetical protein